MPKHGIRSSKTAGIEVGDVPLNRTSLRPYDSGSKCDAGSVSESEYESHSNSSMDEGFTSRRSDITDEFNLPITSLTQHPPVQVMDRHDGHDFFQTPVHDLFGTPESSLNSNDSSPKGSAGSGESLFSLQMNRNSFSNSFAKDGAKSSTTFIGKTVLGKNFNGHEESCVAVSEGLSPANHPITHQSDFVLPLTFPRTEGYNTNENKNKKKKKKKKKKKNSACLSCLCCKWSNSHLKCPTCSCKCFSWSSCSPECLSCSGWPSCSLKCLNSSCWPSCSSKCLSCSGCWKCPSWKSCCSQSPGCNCKCFTWSSCHCKCFTWSSCHCKCPSWSCC